MQTCRFCKNMIGHFDENESGQYLGKAVRYSRRHNAHQRCYLEDGKNLADLRDWQIILFPVKLLQEFGVLDIARAASAREREKSHNRVGASAPACV